MPIRRELHEANRLSWNAAIPAHNSHKADQAGFLREGGSTLFPEELELLGEMDGCDLLHLQCNAGQDSLSLAVLGARVVGVDISDAAIAFARRLSDDSGIPARFVRADVFDWLPEQPDASYDRVFSSYGAICWLSDLETWSREVARLLRPGGALILMEFHPVAMILDDRLEPAGDYFDAAPIQSEDGVDDYVDRSGEGLVPGDRAAGMAGFQNPHPCHEFQWTIAEILGALIEAGLRLERFREYPWSNGCALFDGMRLDGQRRYWLADGSPSLPLMFGLRATRD